MFKKFQEKLFPLLIAFSALSVSASAAFYSISGLSKLFAGAAFAVIIMAASLEIAKLVIASLLYQYRKGLPRLLKYYLSVACVVLILITSMGIYGFLSAAYQETAAKAGTIDAKIELIETKRDNVAEQLVVYNEEKSSINSAVADLRKGLSNNTIQYKDKETGEIITTTSRATRQALEKQLDQAIERQTQINDKVDNLNEQLFNYETEIVEVRTSDTVSSELGPLKYLSGLTGLPMDRIINYLLLTIIFVFDPLAIALVIAANYAFERIRPKTKKNLYREDVVVEDEDEQTDIWDHEKDIDDSELKLKEGWVDSGYWEGDINEEEPNNMYEHAYEAPVEEERSFPEEDSSEIKELEEQIKNTSKNRKRGPRGLAALNKKLNKLKGKNNDDDDLVIRY